MYYVRAAVVTETDGNPIVYLEIDTDRGANTQATANALRQAAYQETGNNFADFSAILWDGEADAIDWRWDYEEDEWIRTELNFGPDDDEYGGPNPLPTNSPQPTATATEFQLDQETLLILTKAALASNGFEVNEITLQGGLLSVKVPQMMDGYEDELTYRVSFIGALVGATVTGFENPDSIATLPRDIQIEFVEGRIVIVRVLFSYADASAFVNGNLTENQFMSRWIAE